MAQVASRFKELKFPKPQTPQQCESDPRQALAVAQWQGDEKAVTEVPQSQMAFRVPTAFQDPRNIDRCLRYFECWKTSLAGT